MVEGGWRFFQVLARSSVVTGWVLALSSSFHPQTTVCHAQKEKVNQELLKQLADALEGASQLNAKVSKLQGIAT